MGIFEALFPRMAQSAAISTQTPVLTHVRQNVHIQRTRVVCLQRGNSSVLGDFRPNMQPAHYITNTQTVRQWSLSRIAISWPEWKYNDFYFWKFLGLLHLPIEGGGEPEYPEKDPIGSELSVLPKDTPPYVRKNSGCIRIRTRDLLVSNPML